jgi:hypothetical protein
MDRRRFLLTSLAGAVTVPLTAGAEQARNYRGSACSMRGSLVDQIPYWKGFGRVYVRPATPRVKISSWNLGGPKAMEIGSLI